MTIRLITARLRSARKALGLSQKEAARRARVSHRLWSEVERGQRRNVSLDTALRLLSKVGITVRLSEASERRRPVTEAAARRSRAVVRRTTWKGQQLRLDDAIDDPPAPKRRAERLSAVSRLSQQAYAVASAETVEPAEVVHRSIARSPTRR